MEKAYSLLSWNVEHFKKTTGSAEARLNRIVDTLKAEDPDVFALYEVEGTEVFTAMVNNFPSYSFHITEGPQTQEILVGVRGSITAFFTQKVEFKTGLKWLRPGALLTLRIDGQNYPVLFLHLKSADDPRSFGLRDDMLKRSVKFAKKLAPKGEKAHYVFIGDLNTMGLNYYFDRDIPAETELKKTDTYASRHYDLERLGKTVPYSWWNGPGSRYPKSNLDHAYAADHLQFTQFNNKNGEAGQSPVDVRGWVDQPTEDAQGQWIDEYSDHAYLYLEVMKV